MNNLTKLPGKIQQLYMIEGIAKTLGMISGKLALPFAKDYEIYTFAMSVIMIVNIVQSTMIDSNQNIVASNILVFLQVFSVGTCLNLQYIIVCTRINPQILGISLELCFCVGNIIASGSP